MPQSAHRYRLGNSQISVAFKQNRRSFSSANKVAKETVDFNVQSISVVLRSPAFAFMTDVGERLSIAGYPFMHPQDESCHRE